MNEICLCGHVQACHKPECCSKCVSWQPQDLILRTMQRVIDGTSLKPEYPRDAIPIERSLLELFKANNISDKVKVQALTADRDKWRDRCERLIGHYALGLLCLCPSDERQCEVANFALQVQKEIDDDANERQSDADPLPKAATSRTSIWDKRGGLFD